MKKFFIYEVADTCDSCGDSWSYPHRGVVSADDEATARDIIAHDTSCPLTSIQEIPSSDAGVLARYLVSLGEDEPAVVTVASTPRL